MHSLCQIARLSHLAAFEFSTEASPSARCSTVRRCRGRPGSTAPGAVRCGAEAIDAGACGDRPEVRAAQPTVERAYSQIIRLSQAIEICATGHRSLSVSTVE